MYDLNYNDISGQKWDEFPVSNSMWEITDSYHLQIREERKLSPTISQPGSIKDEDKQFSTSKNSRTIFPISPF